MAATTADKVIVQLEAKLDGYVAQINGAQRAVSTALDRQARDAARAERQVRVAAEGIKAAFLGAASGLAAGASISAIKELADGYTRYTNQLKTAGLEGVDLADTQERLFEIAQKYGIQLEALGTLYARTSSSARELKLTQQEQLALTQAVAASLKIQGGSTEEASGALLQLSQALGGGKIQAEEFNSLIDGLRPLLQGVAEASTKYGGSVAKLTADVKSGGVTSVEFARLIVKSSDALEQRANKSVLTLGASLQILNNSLGKYIGQTDQSLNLTSRFGGAIKILADNLETIIPALGIILGLIGVRYAAAGAQFVATEIARTAALVRSTLATEAAAAANAQYTALNLRASASAASMAASVSGQAVAMGVATRGASALGSGLLAAFGGPVGLAITAIVLAIGSLVAIEHQAIQATREYAGLAEGGARALRSYEDAALAASIATGKQAKGARDAAAAAREEAIQVRDAAKAKLQSAKASIALLQAEAAKIKNTISPYMGEGSAPTSAGELRLNDLRTKQAQANIKAASDAYDAAVRSILSADAVLNARAPTLLDPPTKDKRSAKQKEIDAAKADGRYSADVSKVKSDLKDVQSIAVQTADDVKEVFSPSGGLADYLKNGGDDFKAAGDGFRIDDETLKQNADDLYRSTYESIAYGLEAGFRDGLPGILEFFSQELQRSVISGLAKGLTDLITDHKGGSGFLATAASAASRFFGRANGGGVVGGRAQIVGEHGPELFIPPQSGQIVPNGRLARSGGGVIQQFNVSFDGAVMTAELVAGFNALVQQSRVQATADGARLGHQQTMNTLRVNAKSKLGVG